MEPRDYATIASAVLAACALGVNSYALTRRNRLEIRAQRLLDVAMKLGEGALAERVRDEAEYLVKLSRVRLTPFETFVFFGSIFFTVGAVVGATLSIIYGFFDLEILGLSAFGFLVQLSNLRTLSQTRNERIDDEDLA